MQPVISNFVIFFFFFTLYVLPIDLVMSLFISSLLKYGEKNETLVLDSWRILFEGENYIWIWISAAPLTNQIASDK